MFSSRPAAMNRARSCMPNTELRDAVAHPAVCPTPGVGHLGADLPQLGEEPVFGAGLQQLDRAPLERGGAHADGARSEEHTSELQSRSDLVCRLLLEKKKEHQKR